MAGFKDTSGTQVPDFQKQYAQDQIKKEAAKTPQQKCEEKGGRWDAVTQTCILVQKPTTAPSPQTIKGEVPKGTIEAYRSAETGRASGAVLPDGRTFLGLSPEEVQKVATGEQDRAAIPENASLVGTAKTQAIQQQQLQEQVSQIGQVGVLSPAEQADVNFSQAITAGAARVLPAAAGGAAVGAAAGLVGSGGALSVPGAVAVGAAGAVGGFVSGVLGDIKEQQRGELQAADVELKNARTSMRQLAMLATQDPQNADVYIQEYNQVLTRVHQARRQTAAEVAGNLNSFMEDGREQLADFDSFLNEGGIADIYSQKMQVALVSGTPLSVYGDELI